MKENKEVKKNNSVSKKKPLKKQRLLLKLFDPWSMPHFLFGALAALASLVFALPLDKAFLATMLGAFLWEYFERKAGIRETSWNIIGDIIMPLAAFGFTAYFVPRGVDNYKHYLALFIVALLLFAYFNYTAWQARSYRARSFLG